MAVLRLCRRLTLLLGCCLFTCLHAGRTAEENLVLQSENVELAGVAKQVCSFLNGASNQEVVPRGMLKMTFVNIEVKCGKKMFQSVYTISYKTISKPFGEKGSSSSISISSDELAANALFRDG